jgi:hypothetical protein
VKSILYLNKEEVFGNAPVYNNVTNKTSTLYCAPFTLSDEDNCKMDHDEIIYRLKVVISNKRYNWCNVHWGPKIVLYWKE